MLQDGFLSCDLVIEINGMTIVVARGERTILMMIIKSLWSAIGIW